MKIEIEISEEDVKSAMHKHVHDLVLARANEYKCGMIIRDAINKQWEETMNKMVTEALKDIPVLKQRIADDITKKLRAQVNAAIRISTEGL